MKQPASVTIPAKRPDLVSVDEMPLVDADGNKVDDETLSYQCKALSGALIDFKKPQNCNYTFFDILRPLSQNCRYNGQVFYPVYVLNHSYWVYRVMIENYARKHGLGSVNISSKVPAWLRLQALLHDAPEAFMGDMIRPLKRSMPKFIKFEDAMFADLMTRLSLPTVLDPMVLEADTQVLHIEQHAFRGQPAKPYGNMSEQEFRTWSDGMIGVNTEVMAVRFVNILTDLIGDVYQTNVLGGRYGRYGRSPNWIKGIDALDELQTDDWFNLPINATNFPPRETE